MDLSTLQNFKEEIYYRGLKTLSIKNITDNYIIFSNLDKIEIIDNEIFLNKKLICNIPDITVDELISLYKSILKQKGYKFL